MNEKPVNQFREGSVTRDLVEGDWENMAVPEIAEVLVTSENMIRFTICRVKKMTGYSIPYRRRRRVKKGGTACPVSGRAR